MNKSFRARYIFLIIILIIATLAMIFRVIDLTVLNHRFLKKQGDARTLRLISIPAHRGMITDRDGNPLAISTPVVSVWVNPQEFDLSHSEVPKLSAQLGLSKKQIKALLHAKANKEFIYLKRHLPPNDASVIKNLQIPGVYFQDEFARFYPESESMAQALGFTNVDDQGQEGIELAYNNWLEGDPGQQRVIKDRLGRVVAELETVRNPKPGHDLQLSLDRRIQYIAFQALKEGVEKFHANAGTSIVVDIPSGEILAMTNYPSFDPNHRENIRVENLKNRSATDTFEPGSTMKTFSAANALESGKYQPNTLIDTNPGYIHIEGKRVEDEHNNGVIDLTTILKLSSNVGISKVTLSLPPTHLWQTLHKFGFGELTSVHFPGERSGLLEMRSHPFALATLSFGYGMNATPLQLAQAYAILGAEGVKYPLTLLKTNESPQGQRILNQKTAEELLHMLQSVFEKGGTAAPGVKIPGYTLTGKTGTARRVGMGGYIHHNYNSSFIGMAPATHPKILVAVVLFNVSGKTYYGGYTAGPIFSNIMGQSLHLLNIPPDLT